MEREVMLTGIGGQGVQLAAQVLSRGATLEGREVLYLGTYGGVMRGGNTDSTVILGDRPISSPPIVARTWGALVMHHQFWEPVRLKLREGGVLALNAGVFEGEVDHASHDVIECDARKLAADAGNIMAASLVLLAAFCGATRLVGLDALVEALGASMPSYRQQHLSSNAAALRAGWATAPRGCAPAWETA